MGTSRSYDGPSDRTPLLPDWATSSGGPNAPSIVPNAPTAAPPVPPLSPTLGRPWQQAKTSLTRYVSGSSPGRAGLSRAGQDYVGARGGSRSAASAASAGRTSVARAGRFFSALLGGNLGRALDAIGLRGLAGRSAEEVFAAIADVLAPDGATLEEAAARRAVSESLAQLFEDRVVEGGLESLERMSAADIASAVQSMVTAYVYQRWLEELGLSLERGAVSPAEAVRMEREMRAYVRDLVRLEIPAERALGMDWEGAEGQAFVQRLFEDAYSLLEAGA